MSSATAWPAIAQRLPTETFLRHIDQHASLGSTNDRALELAADDTVPLPALVLTERQTSGRGRGSNVWRSGPGALTFSLVIERPAELARERMPILSLAAGLAVRGAVAGVANGHAVKVKWPNDVYLDRWKVCGILTEVPSSGNDRVVVGIGLNVNNSFDTAPAELRQRATSIHEATGESINAGELLIACLIQFEAELMAFARAGGLPVSRWSPHCLLTGRTVRLRSPAGETTGRCAGVDENGALLLEEADGLRACRSGEVVAF